MGIIKKRVQEAFRLYREGAFDALSHWTSQQQLLDLTRSTGIGDPAAPGHIAAHLLQIFGA